MHRPRLAIQAHPLYQITTHKIWVKSEAAFQNCNLDIPRQSISVGLISSILWNNCDMKICYVIASKIFAKERRCSGEFQAGMALDRVPAISWAGDLWAPNKLALQRPMDGHKPSISGPGYSYIRVNGSLTTAWPKSFHSLEYTQNNEQTSFEKSNGHIHHVPKNFLEPEGRANKSAFPAFHRLVTIHKIHWVRIGERKASDVQQL